MLRRAAQGLPAARLASIGQGLSLMPVTDALFDSLTDGRSCAASGFWRLPGSFGKALADCSARGPVAYVEAEYIGGVGEQRAAVWDEGTIVLGPLHLEEGRPFPPAGSPISQALRRLGVAAGAEEDEFSAVGLHRHRHSAAWIA